MHDCRGGRVPVRLLSVNPCTLAPEETQSDKPSGPHRASRPDWHHHDTTGDSGGVSRPQPIPFLHPPFPPHGLARVEQVEEERTDAAIDVQDEVGGLRRGGGNGGEGPEADPPPAGDVLGGAVRAEGHQDVPRLPFWRKADQPRRSSVPGLAHRPGPAFLPTFCRVYPSTSTA